MSQAERFEKRPSGRRGLTAQAHSTRGMELCADRSGKRDSEMVRLALHRLQIFSWLPPDKVDALAGGMTLLRFNRQQQIIPSTNLPVSDIYIVLSGAARAGLVNRHGQRVTVEIQEPGHIFGAIMLDTSPETRYFLEALSGTVFGRLAGADFMNITQPFIHENFRHVLALMTRGLWQA